jgi:hypothetical protein
MSNEIVPVNPEPEKGKDIIPIPKDPEELRTEHVDELLKAAFKKSSQLKVSAKQNEILAVPFSDEDVQILPTGECYIPHVLIRQRLTEAFGRGQWTMISTDQKLLAATQERPPMVCVRWILVVNGVRVAETWVAHSYFEDNYRQDFGDAFDSTESIAIRRLAGKSSLTCGSQVWNPEFCRRWQKEFAIKVWVEGQKQPRWRRKDHEKFYKERGPVADQNGGDKQIPQEPTHKSPPPHVPSAEEFERNAVIDEVERIHRQSGMSAEQFYRVLQKDFGVQGLTNLSIEQARAVLGRLHDYIERRNTAARPDEAVDSWLWQLKTNPDMKTLNGWLYELKNIAQKSRDVIWIKVSEYAAAQGWRYDAEKGEFQ